MPRYITQFGIAPDTWAGLAADPTRRVAALGERLGRLDARMIDLYQAFGGGYDGTALFDAADDSVADAAAAALQAIGPGRATRTIRLEPGEHPRDALRRVAAAPAPAAS